MAVPALAPLLNGDVSNDVREQAAFYDAMLQLRDQVFAGTHPRLKLPPNLIPASGDATTALNASFSSAFQNAHSATDAAALAKKLFSPHQTQADQRLASLKPSSSGIDPILLEKSPDLIRAELQLKRQRVERMLKDQVDASRQSSRGDEGRMNENATPLDVSAILAKAQEMVKHVSGLQSATDRPKSTSDSIDENSYYSSLDNSWSTDESAGADDSAKADAGIAHPAAGTIVPLPHDAPQPPLTERQTTVEAADEYSPPEDDEEVEAYEPPDDMLEEGEMEESDYSPPPPDAAAPSGPAGTRVDQGYVTDTGPAYGSGAPTMSQREAQRQMAARAQAPISPDVRIVRNHIQSPLAPQPARVSPLAMNKVPPMEQGQFGNHIQQEQVQSNQQVPRNIGGRKRKNQRSPPNAAPQKSVEDRRDYNNHNARPSKRKREEQQNEKGGRRASGKRIARSPPPKSPEPYIKEEPMSPPPFASFSDPQPPRQRALRPLPDDVEVVSPHAAVARSGYYSDRVPVRYADEPISPVAARVPSRAAYRRAEEPDLRRVASLQYARRPYSPGPSSAVYAEPELRSVRASSHAYPPLARREGSLRPVDPRYARIEGSQSPPPPEAQFIRAYSPAPMAPPPPPRQIVVDQYGRKYYAVPEEIDYRPIAAPPLRRVNDELAYERAASRQPSIRAPPRAVRQYEDDEPMSMAPPPRRYIEDPEVEMIDQAPPSRQRGYSLRPIDTGPVRDEQLRPVSRFEEMPPPSGRAYSVRPQTSSRRAVESEYAPRQQSMQPRDELVRRVGEVPHPRYREVSYVPVEQPTYRYPPQPQQMRYLEDPELAEPLEEMPQDMYPGNARHVSYRY